MNPCASHQELARLLAGELTAAECEALDTHLGACPDCQRALAALSDGDNVVRWRRLARAAGESSHQLPRPAESQPWLLTTLHGGRDRPPRAAGPVPASSP